jgi:hypothetical protein
MVTAIRCGIPPLGDAVFGMKTARATTVAVPLANRYGRHARQEGTVPKQRAKSSWASTRSTDQPWCQAA